MKIDKEQEIRVKIIPQLERVVDAIFDEAIIQLQKWVIQSFQEEYETSL